MKKLPIKFILTSAIALCCLPIAGYASLITLDEGPAATSRANVPANTVPGDVILCDTAVNAARTDCSTPLDRSDIIFINTRNYGGSPDADLYSDNKDPDAKDTNTNFSDLTRVIVTDAEPDGRPLVNTIALLEPAAENGIERILYTPQAGQAGFFPDKSYVFISDVPEPSGLVLLGAGLVMLMGFGRRLRTK